jgi:hypothetical protein
MSVQSMGWRASDLPALYRSLIGNYRESISTQMFGRTMNIPKLDMASTKFIWIPTIQLSISAPSPGGGSALCNINISGL